MGNTECIALTRQQPAATESKQGQHHEIEQHAAHAFHPPLTTLVGVRFANSIYRAGVVAERAVDTRLLRHLHPLRGHAAYYTKNSTVRTEEPAERPADKDRQHQQRYAEDNHSHIATQAEDRNEGVKTADDKLASGSSIENGKAQINPGKETQC